MKISWRWILIGVLMPVLGVSCKDDGGGDGNEAGGDQKENSDTHVGLAEEYFGYLKNAKEGLSSLQDGEAMSKFMAEVEKIQPKLEDLVRRAMALPEPTEDEKKLIEKMDQELNEGLADRVARVEDTPGLKSIGSIGGAGPAPSKISAKDELARITGDFRSIYGLEK